MSITLSHNTQATAAEYAERALDAFPARRAKLGMLDKRERMQQAQFYATMAVYELLKNSLVESDQQQ